MNVVNFLRLPGHSLQSLGSLHSPPMLPVQMVRVPGGRWPSWRLLNDGQRLGDAGSVALKSGGTRASPVHPASWTTRTGCSRRPGSSDPRGVLPQAPDRAAGKDGEPDKDIGQGPGVQALSVRGACTRVFRPYSGLNFAIVCKVWLIWLSGINRPPPKANSIRANERICMTFSVGRRYPMKSEGGEHQRTCPDAEQRDSPQVNRHPRLLGDQACRCAAGVGSDLT